MIARAREAIAGGKDLRVVDDQVGSPTDAWSLALQVRRLIVEDVVGLFHATCRGETTWCGFARAILRGAGIDATVTPVTTAEYPTRARRPPYSVLSGRLLESRGLSVMLPWEDGLRRALAQRGLGAGVTG
jgi:dTDP-4-dehydrorhamnose reductase